MSNHTPGPWVVDDFQDRLRVWKQQTSTHRTGVADICIFRGIQERGPSAQEEANARLIAAAPGLYTEAQVLRCLASSPRFQSMTVADALAELTANGCGHDGGAAIAKAEGRHE